MDILAIIGIVAAIIGIPAAIVQVPGEKLKSPPQNCSAIPGRRQMWEECVSRCFNIDLA